jgi:hypothetical protein
MEMEKMIIFVLKFKNSKIQKRKEYDKQMQFYDGYCAVGIDGGVRRRERSRTVGEV